MTPEDAIAAAELAELETRYRLQLAREMYQRAAAREYTRGAVDGYLAAVADIKAAQHGLVRDAELEVARWGPGGREHFADPRPGDFPGRAAEQEAEAAQVPASLNLDGAESELELEAG